MDLLVLILYALAALPGVQALRLRARGGHGWLAPLRLSLALILLLILGQSMLSLYVDVLWFRELGAERRYWTELSARWETFALGTLIAFAILWGNAVLVGSGGRRGRLKALRTHPRGPRSDEDDNPILVDETGRILGLGASSSTRFLRRARLIVLAGAAILLGAVLGQSWWTFLLYLHRQPFHLADPQFHRDVGFYVFTLPAWSVVASWLTAVFLVAIVTTGLLYVLPAAVAGARSAAWAQPLRRGARHLGILVGVLFLLGAWQTWIARFDLVYSRRGPLVGASAVDARVASPLLALYAVLLVVLGIAAALLARRFRLRLAAGFAAVWIGGAALATWLIPGIYEAVAVKPEQLQAELPYIRRHLDMTRRAFGLDSTHVRVRDLPPPRELTPADLTADSLTVANLRLADWRPLLHTYNQLQTLRTYYRFADVDIDRYQVDGQPREVMLSLRELDSAKVPQAHGSAGWDINRWFIYTHGYGICMNSVNSFSSEGIPELLIRDLPPVSVAPELRVTRPEIYFGELTTNPVMVRARGQKEFDYPRGDDNIFTTYGGQAGIPMGRVLSLRRLAFALRFHSLKFFLSSYVSPDTRILLDRDVGSRLARLAAFLPADGDPYAVLRDDGTLVIMRDLYTVRDRFPYAAQEQGIAYIRNSVKAVLDCYNGTVRFYIVDETDPLARAYRSIYPDLFTDGSRVPEDIRRHFRYPQDLISVQAQAYGTYHVRDPVTFYNHEDVWETSAEILEGTGATEAVLPYYVLMRLPGDPGVEFLQMLPLTPRSKDNMIAWVAGRCDPGLYGQFVAFHLPKGTIAYGPRQIEARIDQDPTISKDLSLWNQQGSQVLRGNLLTVPIDGGFLYAEPLYIQATGGKIPELKRVILATQKDVGYGRTLEEALSSLFGPATSIAEQEEAGMGEEGPQATGESGAAVGPSATASLPAASQRALIRSAAAHLRRYQMLMGAGRAAKAGAQLDSLSRDLNRLSGTR